MTRTELIKYTKHIIGGEKPTNKTKLTSNAKLIHYDAKSVDILISYVSPVAIFSRRTGTLYCFNTYSNTTVKHLYKAAKLLKASRLTWLCKRSDNVIETYVDGRNSFKAKKWAIDNLIKFDWLMEIETKWKFTE